MKLIGTVINNNLQGAQHLIDFPANTTIPVGTEVTCLLPSPENPQLPKIGEAIQGGYFAGIVKLGTEHYGIVVAPKAEGETEGTWGARSKLIAAQGVVSGLENTHAMAEAGSEIAAWAKGLIINGHSEWYIPARDELELIYRNLKPTSNENYCSFRDGDNPSSVPPGALYTDDSPAQTSVAEFQDDEAHAMEEAWYWSSTQCSANNAFCQRFDDGDQGNYGKGLTLRVRAVRRFLIN
jgi:hypothetical protein